MCTCRRESTDDRIQVIESLWDHALNIWNSKQDRNRDASGIFARGAMCGRLWKNLQTFRPRDMNKSRFAHAWWIAERNRDGCARMNFYGSMFCIALLLLGGGISKGPLLPPGGLQRVDRSLSRPEAINPCMSCASWLAQSRKRLARQTRRRDRSGFPRQV